MARIAINGFGRIGRNSFKVGMEKGLDIVAIGPDEHNGHTPDEEVSISSMNRVYQFVRALLEKLAK